MQLEVEMAHLIPSCLGHTSLENKIYLPLRIHVGVAMEFL